MRLYWGCYWRAVLFVIAQIVIMLPLSWGGLFVVNRWMSQDGSLLAIYFVATEAVSIILGFCFVAIYVRFIIGRRIGHVRFALVTDAERPDTMGSEAGAIQGAA
jgi:hypothetical protein